MKRTQEADDDHLVKKTKVAANDDVKTETLLEKFDSLQVLNHQLKKNRQPALPKEVMTRILNLLSYQFIVSSQAGVGEEIAIHNLKTGECDLKIRFDKLPDTDIMYPSCYSVVLSADETLIIAGVEKDVVVYDRKTGRKLREFTGHTGTVYTVNISADKKIIASGSRDNSVRVWANYDNGFQIGVMTFSDYVDKIAISPEHVVAIGGSRFDTVVLWDIQNPKKNTITKTKHPSIDDIVFSSDGKYIMTASRYNDVVIWDAETGDLKKTIALAVEAVKDNTSCYSHINHIVFSPDKKFVGYEYSDVDKRVFYMHDIENDTFKSIKLSKTYHIVAISISPDNKTLVCGKSHGIVLYNIETGEEIMEMYEDSRFDTRSLAISNVLLE